MQIPANLSPYWLLLKDLDTKEKLSLIEMLVKSIQTAQPDTKRKQGRLAPNQDNWVLRFSGSWSDFPESAEDMITLIEGARTQSRPIEQI